MPPKIIAIVNQKGGVGKTTTAVNLATALAAVKRRVLLIDLDPQGNASTGLGVEPHMRRTTSYDLIIDEADVAQAVCRTAIPHLSVIPSTIDLSGAEIELVGQVAREYKLKEALAGAGGLGRGLTPDDGESGRARHPHVGPAYDYVMIDCPPSLGLLTINALVAAHSVLIPLQCEFYALEGLSHLLKTIELVRGKLNPSLTIEGVVLTMYDRRNKLTEQIESDVRQYLKGQVFSTVIPRNVRMSEAPSHGKPALLYDLQCSGSRAYVALAAEMLRRERRAKQEQAA